VERFPLSIANPVQKKFYSLDDLANLPAPKWLIRDVFEANSLVMLAGPAASFKSFLLIDWLLSLVCGRDWCGRKTVQSKVAYVLGEGKASLFKRIQAWIAHNKPTAAELESIRLNFRVTFDVPQLASKASVDNFLNNLMVEDFQPTVVAIDTFARSAVGLDENDARDVGLWIEQADRLRQLGYCVIFLHHTKKNTEFGVQYRGSTAIQGAMDTAMTLVRDTSYCTLTVTKQKDHDEGPQMRFRRILVGGHDEGSCVLTSAPILDARFDGEGVPVSVANGTMVDTIDALLEDAEFESDRARARELAKRTGMNEETANTKIRRRIKERESDPPRFTLIQAGSPPDSPLV
jgi:hypothetical protein